MPYKSEAQRRLFHWLESQGKLSHAKVREYDKATKGKELPEYVKAKRKAFGGEVEAKPEARCPVCDYPLDEIPVALDAGEACPRCGFGNAKDVPHKAHGGMIHGKYARGGEVSCARCGAVHGYARGGKVPMRCAHCGEMIVLADGGPVQDVTAYRASGGQMGPSQFAPAMKELYISKKHHSSPVDDGRIGFARALRVHRRK